MHLRRTVRDISIEALLAWTFGAQRAELEREGDLGDDWNGRGACGTEYVIWQRGAVLGCAIDGGKGYLASPVHSDAETVSAVVSGALRPNVAQWVASLARSGCRPEALIGETPRCLPRAWKSKVNRHEPKAQSMPAAPTMFPGGVWQRWHQVVAVGSKQAAKHYALTTHEIDKREYLGHCTPVSYEPTPQQIDSARTAYLEWWAALHEVRERLIAAPVLRDHRLTGQMPPASPWLG